MKVLSLFSGTGGFDMGLENAGMETVFQCEWDKHANSILHRHWPDVPKWDDISTLTGKHILANAPVIDVVAWGSPCQDLSVAGKRAGLEGGRSGLFHEGIRIIKELQEESNGQYPRISIWENVVGALNSNRGADFGVILDEMAEAGALVIEWAVLDAQYFGIPQRRRRVFVIAIFDPVLASRCPSPLLPVAQSLPRHLAKGKPKRQSTTRKVAEGVGTDGETVGGLTVCDLVKGQTSHQALEQNFLQVVDTQLAYHFDSLSSNSMKSSNPHSGVNEVEQARTLDTWRPDPSLNQGGLAIVEPMLAFDTQFGSNDNVTEDVAPTLKSSQQSPSVAYSIREDAKAGNFSATELDYANSLSALRPSPQSHHAQMFITETYPIDTRNALRDPEKYDAQNRQGLGIGNDGDPMATLTSAHVNAVAYDEFNHTISDTHHSLRTIGISTGVLIDGEVAATLRSGGDGGVPSSRGEHLVTEPTMAVRRLTPLECERLMGWPDNHTLTKADGTTQADTHRYKQCGNGVASPVAQWIAKHLLNI